MSRDQNARRSHNLITERVEDFKYLVTTLTNQNSVQGQIKGRFKSENACYRWVPNPLSSSFLSKILRLRYREL